MPPLDPAGMPCFFFQPVIFLSFAPGRSHRRLFFSRFSRFLSFFFYETVALGDRLFVRRLSFLLLEGL